MRPKLTLGEDMPYYVFARLQFVMALAMERGRERRNFGGVGLRRADDGVKERPPWTG